MILFFECILGKRINVQSWAHINTQDASSVPHKSHYIVLPLVSVQAEKLERIVVVATAVVVVASSALLAAVEDLAVNSGDREQISLFKHKHSQPDPV